MQTLHGHPLLQAPARLPGPRLLAMLCAVLACGLQSGCAALTNPVANGVPVRRLPPELLGESKRGLLPVPLNLFSQPQSDLVSGNYKLAPDDILGVWIEGILGAKGESPPLRSVLVGGLTNAVGYPIPVRDDGTIALPQIPPLKVEGMNVREAQQAVRKAYIVDRQILKEEVANIIVTLYQPRTYHILVVRQDAAATTTAPPTPGTNTGTSGFTISVPGSTGRVARRSAGFALDLPAYQNDLLNALVRTGGIPGQDIADEVIIERGAFASKDKDAAIKAAEEGKIGPNAPAAGQRIRIPLRYRPGQMPQIKPEDIILKTGDTVYVEARPQEVFYTSGILPAGEHPLPWDIDLDVVEAILQNGGAINSGGLSTTNIQGTLLGTGIGGPSPSLCSVVRKAAGGQQVVIRVDINKALNDPLERILIQPGDVVMLQQTPQEALATYASGLFHFNLMYTLTSTSHALATVTGSQ